MYLLILVAASVFYGSAAQNVTACDIHDGECLIENIRSLAFKFGPTGLSQMGISPVEPQKLNATSSTIFDIIKILLIDGTCYDIINTCRISYFELDTENFRRIMDIHCERIVIEFSYELITNPYFCQIFGNVNGCGNATIILEDWIFYFNNPYKFVKRDGDIYLKVNFNQGIYKTNVKKRATFYADSIRVNDKDITNEVLCFINKYWKIVLDIFGDILFRPAADYYYDVYKKLYNFIPATDMFTNYLPPYLNKDEDEDYDEDVDC